MGTVLVLAIAVGVGVLVYRLTAGGEERVVTTDPPEGDAGGSGLTGDEPAASRPARSSGAGAPAAQETRVPEGYIRVSGTSASWHDRLGGAMGLVIAVAVGAIALALSLWAVVVLVARLASGAGA